MDKKRKKKVRLLIGLLRQPEPNFEEIQSELEYLKEVEEEARDNKEEYFSETEQYQILSENCDYLEEALDNLDPDDPDCAEDIIAALQQIDGV